MSTLEFVPFPGKRPFPPRVSTFTRPFWDALDSGRLMTTRCGDCGQFSFPPRPLCRACWSEKIQWVELKQEGTLYSFTRVHVVPRAFGKEIPYCIGVVDLADGVRFLCRMVGEVTPVAIGKRIRVVVAKYDDGPLFAARLAP